MKQTNPLTFLPLREPTFYILLSLVTAEKHGYAILKEVETLSESRVRLSTGTLYEALARLCEQGLIERSEPDGLSSQTEPIEPGPGKPRKTYRLTSTGRQVIESEAARLSAQAAAARLQLEKHWIKSTPASADD